MDTAAIDTEPFSEGANKMSTTPPSQRQSKGLSPELVERLSKLSPADRDKVIDAASKLLAIRAKREAEAKNGSVDLTVKPD